MAEYRIKAQKTGPRTYKKELQLINYRGSSLFNDEGNTLISEKDVYYPPDYLGYNSVAVVTDSESYESDGISVGNKFRRGRPAALPIEEQFPRQTEVSRTLLGIDRSETQQGLFDDVSSYGLDRKDWVAYSGWPDWRQGQNWENKNSPAGPHIAARNYDYAEGSSVVLSTYPVPYYNPGNPPVSIKVRGGAGNPGPEWGRYIQSIIAMYIIEHMVNNFTDQEKGDFRVEFLEQKYPKTADGRFNRLYWDQMWMDIDQGRFEENRNIPIIPQGTIVNLTPEDGTIDLVDLFGADLPVDEKDVNVNFNQFFFGSTRYGWFEPDEGHYRIKTTASREAWSEYWGIDYDALPQKLQDWEFEVYESEEEIPAFVKRYKLPYFLITSKVPSESLIFGPDWPQPFGPEVPQISGAVAVGNIIGARQSNYAVQTLTSTRAFRYQPGRISGFTYGTRISEEGAGPGTTLEWGVENFTDGYFFRLEDGTDFAVVRRSIIPLGSTPLFIEAGYEEREGYLSQITGVVEYKDTLSETEQEEREEQVADGNLTKIFETVIQQNQMNGDGLNSQGDSGYIYNADTVTMYKIEFGWYGAIGARFYVYIPQSVGESRWVAVHTLVIENQLGEPCLGDPFFFFKYRAFMGSPSRIRLPQFVEKYGASYYIDGGDEGTVSISSGSASNREIKSITLASEEIEIYDWSTVIGLKPKQFITNNDGNIFQNKKEIFPISASVSSTVDAEIKFVSQFGCQEHGYTFQEGYTCVLPESQRLRGYFSINRLRKDESTLIALGRDEDSPAPTITYVESDNDFAESASNLEDSEGNFIGWDAYENSIHGSKIVADKVYGAYVNPEIQGTSSSDGFSGNEALLARVPRDSVFTQLPRTRSWSYSELLFRYKENIRAKLSRYRRDTTLLSTVDIRTNEFYLFFANPGSGEDQYEALCTEETLASRCDGSHFGDISFGVLWPNADNTTDYPKNVYNKDRAQNNNKSFGIIDPKITQDRTNLSGNNKDVKILEDSGYYYVQDKTIPNPDSYRYYEGLPLDLLDPTIANNNTLRVSQAGWVIVGQGGLEVAEGSAGNGVGGIDSQLPGIPGREGGRCRAIFGRVGDIEESATFTNKDENGIEIPDVYYLTKDSSWPGDLASDPNDLLVLNEATGASITVTTTGDAQRSYIPDGSGVRLFLLPVTISSGSPFNPGTTVSARYRAIALYSPSILRPDARIIARKVVGQNIFPIRFFLMMKEGASVGGLTIGQVTPNGIIQTPFTPHGSTLSITDPDAAPGPLDRHDGGSSDDTTSAFKAIKTFIEPNTLSTADFSYYDTSGAAAIDKTKKCTSFISRTLLSGAGFSGVGDYPIRWLKFKESGDPVGSLYVSANKPTELDLSQFFGISTESVGPSFWSNKALFVIARNLEENTTGKMSITLNYKEQ